MDNIISKHWKKAAAQPGFKNILAQVPPLELRKVLQRRAVRDALREFLLHIEYRGGLTFKFKEWGTNGVEDHPIQLSNKAIAMELTNKTRAGELGVALKGAASQLHNNKVEALAEPMTFHTPCAKVIAVLYSEFRTSGDQLQGPKLLQVETTAGLVKVIATDKQRNWKEFEYFWNIELTYGNNYLRSGVRGEQLFDCEALDMSADDLKKMHHTAIQEATLSIDPDEPFTPHVHKLAGCRRREIYRGKRNKVKWENQADATDDGDDDVDEYEHPKYEVLGAMTKQGLEALRLNPTLEARIPKVFGTLRAFYKLDTAACALLRLYAKWWWLTEGLPSIPPEATSTLEERSDDLKKIRGIVEHHDPLNTRVLKSIENVQSTVKHNENSQWQALAAALRKSSRKYAKELRKQLSKFREVRKAKSAEYWTWLEEMDEKAHNKKMASAHLVARMAQLTKRREELKKMKAESRKTKPQKTKTLSEACYPSN